MEDHPHPAVTHRRAISPAKTLLEFDCKNRRGVTARLGIVDADPRSAGDGDGLGGDLVKTSGFLPASSPRNPEAASLPRPAANASRSSHSSAQASRASSLTSGQGSPNTRWARARRVAKIHRSSSGSLRQVPQTSLLPAPRGEPVPDLADRGRRQLDRTEARHPPAPYFPAIPSHRCVVRQHRLTGLQRSRLRERDSGPDEGATSNARGTCHRQPRLPEQPWRAVARKVNPRATGQ